MLMNASLFKASEPWPKLGTKCFQSSAWISITVSSFNEFSNEFFSSFGRSRFYLDRYQAESLIPHFLYMQGFSFFPVVFFVFVLFLTSVIHHFNYHYVIA